MGCKLYDVSCPAVVRNGACDKLACQPLDRSSSSLVVDNPVCPCDQGAWLDWVVPDWASVYSTFWGG